LFFFALENLAFLGGETVWGDPSQKPLSMAITLRHVEQPGMIFISSTSPAAGFFVAAFVVILPRYREWSFPFWFFTKHYLYPFLQHPGAPFPLGGPFFLEAYLW